MWPADSEAEADYRADLARQDRAERMRFQVACADRMCGADDCQTCHPEILNVRVSESGGEKPTT